MFRQDVLIKLLRHNDLSCYNEEGFGGKTLKKWPVYKFFSEYIVNPESAINNYTEWYQDQLDKYSDIPNSEGGMYKGSLFRFIEEYTGKEYYELSRNQREVAVRKRVIKRFELIEDIKMHGYDTEKAEKIYALRKKGLVYLKGGHHRAVILLVLGYENLPDVFVFPNETVYNVFQYIRILKTKLCKFLKTKKTIVIG